MKLKTFKAGLLGLVLIGTSIYVMIAKDNYDTGFMTMVLATGILLLFVPDKFINAIEKKILGREIKLPFLNDDK
jgi:hypothetical protein